MYIDLKVQTKRTVCQMKFLIGACGIGLGHAGRSVKLAELLTSQGHEVFFTTFGDAYDFINLKGYTVYKIPPYEWYSAGTEPHWSMSAIYGAPIIHRIVRGYKKILKIIKKEGHLDYIISDTDFPTLLTLARHNFEGCILTNTLRIGVLGKQLLDYGVTGRILRPNLKFLFNRKIDDLFLYLYKRTNKVYCFDFPPPYTLARHNVLPESFDGELRYCGLIKGKDPKELPSKEELMEKLDLNPDLPTIYIGISGPNKYQLINFFANHYDGCRDKNIIITTGTPSSSLPSYRNKELRIFHWYPVREELLKVADVIVARAGLNTISELLNFGKKAILIPELQPEQMENAHSLESRGLCVAIHEKALNEEIFNIQLARVLENNQMTKRLKEYQSLCRRYDALSMITNDFN